MKKESRLFLVLFILLGLYLFSYGFARATIFQTIENYAGGGKVGARQDFITKRDSSPKEGWEYWLFFPVIRVEESITNFFYNL
jgi:hypothetical protein